MSAYAPLGGCEQRVWGSGNPAAQLLPEAL